MWVSRQEIAKLDALDINELAAEVEIGLSSRQKLSLLSDEALDEEIDTLIDQSAPRAKSVSGACKGVQVITAREKREILRLLALGYADREILPKIDALRQQLGKPPLTKNMNLAWYKERYKPLLKMIQRRFVGHVEKACRFSSKFVRIRQLNDVAESVVDAINQAPGIDKDYRENVRLLNHLFELLHKEMGITKFSYHVREIKHLEQADSLNDRWQKVKDRLAFSIEDVAEIG